MRCRVCGGCEADYLRVGMPDLHKLLGLSPEIDWVIEQSEVTIAAVRELEVNLDCRIPTALVDCWLDAGAFKVWPGKKSASGDPLFSVLHPSEAEAMIDNPYLIYEHEPFTWLPIVQSGGSTLSAMHPGCDPDAIVSRFGPRVLAPTLKDALRRFREDHDFVQRDYEDERERERQRWIHERDQLLRQLGQSQVPGDADQLRAQIASLEEMIAVPLSRIRTAVLVDEAIEAVGARSLAEMKAVMDRLKGNDRIDPSLARSIAREKLGSNANLAR